MMQPTRVTPTMPAATARAGAHGSARAILLVLVAFGLGAGLTAVWFQRQRAAPAETSAHTATTQVQLSPSTRAVLNRLDAPVEVRCYALLEAAGTPEPVKAFAQRVNQLLAHYVQAANGNLKLTRLDSLSQANANAALADGLKPVHLGTGEDYFLGVAFALKGQTEAVPQLGPEYEPALESDLTRALDRLLEETHAPNTPGAVSQLNSNANALEQVKALIPNLDTVSLADGTRLLREAALKNFQAAAQDLEDRVKAAQQQLADAQNGKSDAEQQAAMQQLQQVQAEQSQKLKAIAAQSQAQIKALQQLKSNP